MNPRCELAAIPGLGRSLPASEAIEAAPRRARRGPGAIRTKPPVVEWENDMRIFRMMVLAGTATLALGDMALAVDQHHQDQPAATSTEPASPQPQAAAPSTTPPKMNMMGQGGMGMMGQGGMGMMGQGGMGMMGPGGPGQPGMPMMGMGFMAPGGVDLMGAGISDHIEGRIAFLRAELAITEAQAPQWEAFAQALRDGNAKLKQAQTAAPQSAAESLTFLQRTELQAQWLNVRLEGLNAIKTAFAGLQAVLSEDQKKNAEALLTRPVCFGQMGMI
jgi:hypothetical protein